QNDHDDPDGLASARGVFGSGGLAPSFLFQPSNQAGAQEILDGKVAYLEGRDPTKWTASPLSSECSDDVFCPSHHPGTYCDRTNGYKSLPAPGTGKYGDVGSVVGRCMPLESAVLRAFRSAELPYWCANDTVADFEAARATCQHSPFAQENAG